jgi:hypothetical protein
MLHFPQVTRQRMRTRNFSALLLAIWSFFFNSAIAGQIIFHGQGDTPAVSFRYGLLYVLYAGVPGAFRGEYPFIISLTCELFVAGFFYWLGRRQARTAWTAAAVLTAAGCLWFVITGPQLFV